MNRLNQVLVGLLVLQLVVAAVVFWPRPAGGESSEALFPDLQADQVVALTVDDGEGNTVQLAKREGRWVLPGAADYPALEESITSLLQKLAGLQAGRLVTQTGASHARLQVASGEFDRRIQFELADGSRHVLYLGSSPSYQATHVRVEGQNEVYLISDLSSQDAGAQASAWVQRSYFSLPADDVLAVTLENADGTFAFAREGESWIMDGLVEGETFDSQRFQSLLNGVTSISLVEPLGTVRESAYGMDEPAAVLTLHTGIAGAARTYTLEVGAQDPEDNTYVVKSSESPY